MAKSKNDQKARDNSTQIQAERDVHIGITVMEATEIAKREAHLAVAEFSSGALVKATERSNSLANRIIDVFSQRQELLGAFGEPDFNFALRDASRAAVSNDEEHTEDLLVDLLTNRAEQGGSPRMRLVTSRAIVAADKLSLEALNGLTRLWVAGYIGPLGGNVPHRLESFNRIVKTLTDQCPTPQSSEWLGDLDLLGLVRLLDNGLSSRTSYDEYLSGKFPIYTVPGISNEAAEPLLKAVLAKHPVIAGLIEDHPLKDGFKLIRAEDKDTLMDQLEKGGITVSELPELEQLLEQNQFGVKDPSAMTKLREMVKEDPILSEFASWWDPLPPINFTAVGDAVGFVNARRHISFQGAQNLSDFFKLRATSK